MKSKLPWYSIHIKYPLKKREFLLTQMQKFHFTLIIMAKVSTICENSLQKGCTVRDLSYLCMFGTQTSSATMCPHEDKNRSILRFCQSTLGHTSKEYFSLLQINLLYQVHCYFIHSIQKLETTQMFLHRDIDKYNVTTLTIEF